MACHTFDSFRLVPKWLTISSESPTRGGPCGHDEAALICIAALFMYLGARGKVAVRLRHASERYVAAHIQPGSLYMDTQFVYEQTV